MSGPVKAWDITVETEGENEVVVVTMDAAKANVFSVENLEV